MEQYLKPTYFLDFEDPAIQEFTSKNSEKRKSDKENAVRLYYAVRDQFKYDPYKLDLRRTGLRASNLVGRTSGYCIEKALLLAAASRAVAIPSRLSFYIVQNHLATGKVEKTLRTNKLVFHGAAELLLDGKWIKLTPAFDQTLCDRLQVAPLEFDGSSDAVFQQFDKNGRIFMEYIHDYGNFEDMPYELAISELKSHYPHIFEEGKHLTDELVINLSA